MKDQDTSQQLSSATGGGIPLTYVIALVPVASVMNVIGGTVASALKLPIFLDMIGTAVVAMTIGGEHLLVSLPTLQLASSQVQHQYHLQRVTLSVH